MIEHLRSLRKNQIRRPVAVTLEIERLTLLYRQNVPGLMGLMLYALSYAYVCGDVMGTPMLTIWLSVVMASCIARVAASFLWRKKRGLVHTLESTKPWLYFLQSQLLISGAAWGVAGWMMRYSHTATQQVFVSLTVVFMVAGAMVCWSISKYAMFFVVLPAFIPWILGQILSEDPLYILMGVLSLVYLIFGTRVGISLNRYVENSLKLNIENIQLNEDLQNEIEVKTQTENSMRLALSASNAMQWSWHMRNDEFICEGDLHRSLGLDLSLYINNRAGFLKLLLPEDRQKFETQLDTLVKTGGDMDLDVRILWPDGKPRTLVFRGNAQLKMKDEPQIKGIAWDATSQKIQVRIQQERDVHEAANKAKSMFLANASHEIRTPLAAISGFVETLLNQVDDAKANETQMRADLKSINRNTKHLISLVNDFLDLSKLETGKLYTQRTAMNLKNEIEEAVLMVRSALDSKSLTLKLKLAPNLPVLIESDSLRFRQILVNLLSNAIKFSDEGEISIQITHEADTDSEGLLRIKVSDSGIGMDEKTLSHLFEPFIRGSSEEVQRVSGSGLGLTLSRNLARLLGGDLRLLKSAVNQGSEFELTISTGAPKNLKLTTRSAIPKTSSQLRHQSILVVDDDQDLRELMRRFLERHGAMVDVAHNGRIAVDKALENKSYQVILMDMKMPVLDGYEATAELRRRGYRGPVIALTAYANTEDKQKSLQAGCDNYLTKPVNFDFMLETISSYSQTKMEHV